MGFSQALSGLNASEKALGVIGNNIANATTVGFKSQTAHFSDVYAGAVGDNALGRTQVGSGTYISDVATNYKQGTPTQTGNDLDMAINGAGFFRMEDASGSAYYTRNGQFYLDKDGYIRNQTANNTYLTGFPVDQGGKTVGGIASPLYVQTPMMDPSATTKAFLTGNFDSRSKAPYVDFSLPDAKSVPDPKSYNTSTSQTIYDSLGNSHSLNYYFTKTGPNRWTAFMAVDFGANNNVDFTLNGAGSNYLNLQQFQQGDTNALRDVLSKYPKLADLIGEHFPQPDGAADGAGLTAFDAAYTNLITTEPGYGDLDTVLGFTTANDFLTAFPDLNNYLTELDTPSVAANKDKVDEILNLRGSAVDIVFDSNGHMIQPADPSKIGITITGFQTTTGAFGPGEVNNPPVPPDTVDLGALIFNIDMSQSTQFGQSSSFTRNSADGNTAGDFSGISVGDDGVVSAKYTNGKSLYLGQVALATFPSTHGLARLGDNLYGETFNSGQPVIGPAGTGLNGTVIAGNIEESNVDLTNELVQMIVQQRSYQANAQTIKAQDTILQTVVNLR